MARGLIDGEYLGDLDVRSAINDHMERSRSGDRVVRDIDTQVALKWYRNQPFYRRSETNRLQEIKPEFRKRYVPTNVLFESVRTISGTLVFSPKVEPFPRSADRGDWARSRMNASIGNYVVQTGRMDRVFSWAQDLAQIGGYAVIKPIWDPEGGEIRPQLGTVPCPQCGGEGALVSQFSGVSQACPTCSAQGLIPGPNGYQGVGYIEEPVGVLPEGSVRFECVPPWEYFPDPDAPTIHDSEQVIHRRKMSRREAWLRFGKQAGFSQADFQSVDGNLDSGAVMMRSGPFGFGRSDDQYVTVYEFWRQPDETHPDGVFAVMIGDEVVVGGRYPTVLRRHPFFVVTCYEVYGALYPMSTADIIIPLCQVMNDHVSAQHARERLSARLRFISPRESRVRIDESTGNIVYVHSPSRPAPQPAFMPPASSNMELVNFLYNLTKNLSGANDVLRGQASGGIESARGGAWFEERALKQFSQVQMQQAESLGGAIKYGIDLFRLNAGDGRQLRLVGSSGAWEVSEFNVAGMGIDSDDVRLVLSKWQGRSRGAMAEELNNAADRQMIDGDTYQRLMEFGDMGQMSQSRRVHENQANLEFQTLKRSQTMPPPALGQHHKIHIEQHRLQVVDLETEDPSHPLLPWLRAHLQATMMMDAQETAQAQMAVQAAAQQYGAINAAAPGAQPPQTQAMAQQVTPMGAPSGDLIANPGAPGTQATLESAAASARAADIPARAAAEGA